MALGYYFAPTSMTAQQYDTITQKLEAAGEGSPRGRLYHTCFGEPDKLAVFDVWESRELFERFGHALMPILKELGLDAGAPQVMPIHNIIKG